MASRSSRSARPMIDSLQDRLGAAGLGGDGIALGDAHGCNSWVGARRSVRTGRNGRRNWRADCSSPKSTTGDGARKYEMTSRATMSMSDPRLRPRQELVGERDEVRGGHPDDARQAVDGELAEHGARLGRQHEREVVVVAQLARGARDRAAPAGPRATSRPRSGRAASVKNRSSSYTRWASKITSRPPGKIRYIVARDTPDCRAMSSTVTLSMPHRSQHRFTASRTATSVGAHSRRPLPDSRCPPRHRFPSWMRQ